MADMKELQGLIDDLYRDITKLKAEKREMDENSLDASEKELAILEQQVKVRQAELTLARQKGEGEQDAIRYLEETVALHRQQLDLLEKQREVWSEVDDLSRDFASEINGMLGIMENVNQNGFGQMLSLIEKSGGTINAINNAALKLSENLKTRIVLSLAEKGEEMFLKFFHSLDEAGANLAKAIPQGREYQKMVNDITTGNQAAFLSFEQVSESVISLNTNFTEFSRLSDPEKMKLIRLSATLDKIGVSVDTLSENLDISTKALGMSTEEFENFQGELFTLSKQLGTNMDTLNKRFKDVSGRLSQFEKTKAVKIFKEMNIVAKNLGIEFNKLFDITENFTTFEGAAEAAGSLNSVLGGNLINTIDLMNAALDNPIDVFKQFKVAIDKTGKSFDSMTPAMKRMIAETMKMDVSEVERLMRMDMSQGIAEMENTAASIQEMEEAARKATPVIDKLINLGYKFAVAIEPVVDMVGSFVDWFSKLIGKYPMIAKVLGGIALGLAAITVGLTLFGKAVVFLKALTMGSGAGGIVGALVGKAAGGAPSVVLTKIGASAAAGAKGFLALGAAALMVGAGIGLAALGVSQFVLAFKGMSPEQIQAVTIALGVFTIGITIMVFALSRMAAASVKAGVALLPLGVAIGLIGAGIGFAAWGASKLVESFTQFMQVADLGKLANLYLGINGLSMAFAGLAASFVAIGLASPNLIAFGLAVRVSLTDTVINKLQKVAEYVSMITTNLQNMRVEKIAALASAAAIAASVSAAEINQKIAVSAENSRQTTANTKPIVVQVPGETINIHLKGDIILDNTKVGEFVQEEIVKREDRLVPGGIQPSVGIKTGRYND